jgi:hypothetical protein
VGQTAIIFLAWAWPALLVTVPAVFVTWWAIFGDKPRGRRRCPRCWHDLSRTPGLTCGECGHAARDERELSRTRRRWGIAAAAVAATATVAAATQLSILNASWAGYLPDAVLVRLPGMQPLGELPAAVRRELGVRTSNRSLDAGELLTLARGLASHGPLGAAEDPAAALLGTVAGSSPAELDADASLPPHAALERAGALREWRAAMEALLRSIPPWTEVTAPARWPRAEPAVAFVRATAWGARAEWRIRRRGDGGPWLVGAGIAGLRHQPGPVAIDAGAVGADGRLRAEFDFEVRHGEDGDDAWGPWIPAPPRSIDAAVPSMDGGALTEATGPDLDAMVARALESPLTLWNDPARPVAFRIGMAQFSEAAPVASGEEAPSTAPRPVAFGLVAELREGDTVRRRMRLATTSWRNEPTWLLELEDAPGLAPLRELAATAGGDAADLPGWTLLIRSDRRIALTAIGRWPARPGTTSEACWSGSVVLPAKGIPTAEKAPPRSYRHGFSDECRVIGGKE